MGDVPRIHFEAADTTERTEIGEGLVRFAVQAGRLETGRAEGRYFLAHDDGCRDCDAPLAPGDPFCFDTDTGDVLCMDHGTAREDHEQREGDEPDAAD